MATSLVSSVRIFYPFALRAATRGPPELECLTPAYRVMETYGEESEVRPVVFLDEEALEFEARRKALTALAELAAEKVKELGAGAE